MLIMYYMFIPDPNCPPRRYKQFETLEKAENYLKIHHNVYRSFTTNKKCSILEKGTDRVVKVHKFK